MRKTTSQVLLNLRIFYGSRWIRIDVTYKTNYNRIIVLKVTVGVWNMESKASVDLVSLWRIAYKPVSEWKRYIPNRMVSFMSQWYNIREMILKWIPVRDGYRIFGEAITTYKYQQQYIASLSISVNTLRNLKPVLKARWIFSTWRV